jgi:hypothetical protein
VSAGGGALTLSGVVASWAGLAFWPGPVGLPRPLFYIFYFFFFSFLFYLNLLFV